MLLGLMLCGAIYIAATLQGSRPVARAEDSAPATGNKPPAEDRPAIGDQIAPLAFKDIRFLPRTLRDFVSDQDPAPKRFFVLIFTNTSCPLVQRYLPRLKEMEAEYRGRGVQFVSVNVGADDSILDMAAQAVKFDVPFPFVKDSDGSCARACGARRTPEAVVLDAERRLRYRGRIDDRYRLGGAAREARHQELRDALEDLLAGREVAVAETPVDGCLITFARPAPPARNATYYEHVAPLIEKHCQSCHQPNTAAPFSLLTYDDVASYGEMIAEVVADRRMPPWYAAEEFGEFENCAAMTRAERETLIGWIAAGMPRGEEAIIAEAEPAEANGALEKAAPNDAKPVDPADSFAGRKWMMGDAPDLVLTAPETYEIPADGYVDYQYAVLPFLATGDMWYSAVEIMPDNPRVVHHCNLGHWPIGGKVSDAKLVTGYVPGGGPAVLGEGIGGKIPRGSLLVLQIHFTTTGKPEKCRLRVGFRYPRETINKELRYLQIADFRFRIPPHEPFHRVSASRTVDSDVTARGLFAHMHVRGRDMTFLAHPPQGEAKTMLMIPNYSFDWQLAYYLPRGREKYPAGTRFECVAHYDNSIFNPYNPDPNDTVREGQQTYQEMMYGYVFYTKDDEKLNLEIDPQTGRARK